MASNSGYLLKSFLLYNFIPKILDLQLPMNTLCIVNWFHGGKFCFKDNRNLMGTQFKIQCNDFFFQIITAMKLSEKKILTLGILGNCL